MRTGSSRDKRAKRLIEAWRQEYNEGHPHRAFYETGRLRNWQVLWRLTATARA